MFSGGWNFHNPTAVRFAPGGISSLPTVVSGQRVLLVTSPGFRKRGMVDTVRGLLGDRLVADITDVDPNPDIAQLEHLAASLEGASIDSVVGIGGGSVLDTAKVLGVLLDASGGMFSLREHLEEEAPRFAGAGLPVVTVPTTAGTGSEVTPFSTVWNHAVKRKYSLAGPFMFPQVAILDPALMTTLPMDVMIATGLDAVSQALESIWNRNAGTLTIAMATTSARMGISTLQELMDKPQDSVLHADMLQASLLAGLAISQTRTAIAHSISYPLTAHFGIPHGLACSFTLPAVLEFNAVVDDGRLVSLANSLGYAGTQDLAAKLRRLLEVAGAGGYILPMIPSSDALLALQGEMITKGRADNNMRDVGACDLEQILLSSYADLAAT